MKLDKMANYFPQFNFVGIYPDCQCKSPRQTYNSLSNECAEPCPLNAVGLHPNCKCNSSSEYYDEDKLVCRSSLGRPCPKASIGVGPYCLCIQEGAHFNSHEWRCIAPGVASSIGHCLQSDPECISAIDHKAILSMVG